MVREFHFKHVRIDADRVQRRRLGQWRRCAVANPAFKSRLSRSEALIDLACTIIQLGQRSACRDHINLRGASTAIGSFSGRQLEGGRCFFLRNQRHHGFGVVTVEPRQGRVALDAGNESGLFRHCPVTFTIEALCAKFALSGARKFLTDPDAPHSEIVAPDTEAMGAIDGPAIETNSHYRIGELTRSDGHLLSSNKSRLLR